ncbi:MAG: carbohydrate ABC transporter permease [Acidimicrobiales bacterium]|jgi:ABC-type glycerol-3-phosphate transport system permease component
MATITAPYEVRRLHLGAKHALRRAAFILINTMLVVSALFPFYWILATSMKTTNELNAGTTGIFPAHLTFQAYHQIFSELDFAQPLLNSVIVATSTMIVTVVLATFASYALARLDIRGRGVVLGFVLLAGFFPILAMVGPLFLVYRHIGLLNSYPGLVFAYLIYTLPLSVWLLTNYFRQIPKELDEAAMVDGASRLQVLRRVIAPVAAPSIFTAGIISFILAWNDFTFALCFESNPHYYTAPLAIVNLGQSQFQIFYNQIDAAVVVVTLPVALIVLVAQRRIMSGLTAGAIK